MPGLFLCSRLIGFLINGVLGPLTGKPLPKIVAGSLGTAAVFASFVVAVMLFLHVTSADAAHKMATVYLAPWLSLPTDPQGIHSFVVNYELLIDPLSVLMMLIITGVGGLIHLYSTAYMAEDKGYQRFFTYLNLFVFFMLMLVMSNNILGLFIGWEGVGLCSYLLIGFFYEKKSAGDAAKKAFIVNRIGDVGVLIGMFFVFHYFGTLDFVTGHSAVTGITEAAPMLASGGVGHGHCDTFVDVLSWAAPASPPKSPVYLAPGCNGRSNPGVGADPRGDDGDGRHLSGIPHSCAV